MKKDVIVIGAGIAGLSAAIEAKKSGSNVVIVTKDEPTRSQSVMAQGGINGVVNDQDSVQSCVDDIIKSAYTMAREDSVYTLCQKSKEAIEWLDSIGVGFEKNDNKYITRGLGGASYKRACYSQDYTGLKIMHALYEHTISLKIPIYSDKYLLNIIKNNSDAIGVTLLDIHTSIVEELFAPSIILATGGYARVYHDNSTNHTGTTGDGLVCAYRANIELENMHMIQFHPTTLKSNSILISESARAEGGYLVDENGDRFIDELSTRDIVSRAIWDKLQKSNNVFLDIRHLGEKFISQNIPQEAKLAKFFENINPASQLIPIKPSAHYSIGGIKTNEETQTSLNGVYACGEVASSGVHGANRLGGNSLLEGVVFGKIAGKNASKYAKNSNFIYQDNSLQYKKDSSMINNIFNSTNNINFYSVQENLGNIMYNNVGISRDEASLIKAKKEIENLQNSCKEIGISDKSKSYNTNLVNILEFKNRVEISSLITQSALEAKVSCGAHFRSDY